MMFTSTMGRSRSISRDLFLVVNRWLNFFEYPYMHIRQNALSQEEIIEILFSVTGRRYKFATENHKMWEKAVPDDLLPVKGYFRLIPVDSEDDFFKWYIQQPIALLYISEAHCALEMLHYFYHWRLLTNL